MARRADFPAAVRRLLAERAGYQCSVLNCGKLTIGPGQGSQSVVNMGMAAHIYAAVADGPRGNGGLSEQDLRSPDNGIWCCYSHGKIIDSEQGRSFSASELKAWKRLHEARKGAEVLGVPVNNFGFVESVSAELVPGLTSGSHFPLGIHNVILGNNGSGKSQLTRLIASVSNPDLISSMAILSDVDVKVQWFDPLIQELTTRGRKGRLEHELNGYPVPYIARPYKTIRVAEESSSRDVATLVGLAQMLDLSIPRVRSLLESLAHVSETMKDIRITSGILEVAIEDDRPTRWVNLSKGWVPESLRQLLLVELAAHHARNHARVEPTFLILDGHPRFVSQDQQQRMLEKVFLLAEGVQVAVTAPFESPAVNIPSITVTELVRDQSPRLTGGPFSYRVSSSPSR